MLCGASCTIYRQQGQASAVASEAREKHGLPPLGTCEWAPPAVTSGVGKKKRALHPSTIHFCSHSPGNTPALLLPMPNTLGTAYICLIIVASQDPATRNSLHSTSYVG